jgi:hypothetical protein
MHAPDDSVELVDDGRRRRIKHWTTFRIAREDAIEDHHVEVDVEVDARAKPLHEGEGARRCRGEPVAPGPRAVAREDGLDEDAGERREDVGAKGGDSAQLEGQREDPPAHRDSGQDAIDKVRGSVHHPPASAAGTHASVLAREGYEQIVSACVPVCAHEAVREYAAAQVRAEFLLDVARHGCLVRLTGVGEECLEVRSHHVVEDGLGRATGPVGGGENGHGRGPLVAACQCRRTK